MTEGEKQQDRDARGCPACGGATADGYVINSEGGRSTQFHGKEKGLLGTSARRTPIGARICTTCGLVALYGANPSLFQPEVEGASGQELAPALPPEGRGDELSAE